MAENCELITLVGEIDMTRSEELSGAFASFCASPSAHALVDLSDVSFFGSEGVGFLARLAQEARSRAGTVTLINPDDAVTRLIEITGLDGLMSSRVSLTRSGPAPATAPAGQGRPADLGLPAPGLR
jgi:anti-sigma B factor antagonist